MEVEEYYNNYQLGIDIWKNKYQVGNETFNHWLSRISNNNDEVKQLIINQEFMFGGRILANREVDKKVSYSNCYFLPRPKDSLESIYKVAGQLSRVYSVGGGGGIDLSLLAPRGASINNAAKVTSGAVSFAELYNTTTALIGQDGRRGALMLSIDDSHLDLEEFITAKSVEGKLEKANLSVKLYDKFMMDVINNNTIAQSYTRNGITISKDINPNDILHTLASQAHEWSEPGALFWDTIQSWNAMSEYDDFELVGVNPCGEVPLPEGGACLLGSMVLSNFVQPTLEFEYKSFEMGVRNAVRGLNEVLDEGIKRHPLTMQSEVAEKFRQIGLGVMGYADMLIKMESIYGSDEALKITQNVSVFMCDKAFNESALLAKEFGPFPGYDREATLNSEFIHANVSKETFELISEYGLRNATILSIAPTGTLSTMLDISGGIEPMYALEYNRKTESLHGEDVIYKVQPKIVREYMVENNIDNIEDLPEWFITSKNINSSKRIQTQSIWQKHIDSAISSTINLPNSATPEDIYNIYIEAYRSGLKGITVHREGNRREGVLTEDSTSMQEEYNRGDWRPISDDVVYYKKKVYTGCGQLNLFIGYSKINNRIEDLYIKRSGNGSGCVNNIDAFIIAASGMLRLGGNFDNVKQALQGLGSCNSFTRARLVGKKLSKGANCGTAILNTIDSFNLGENLPIHMQKKIIDIIDIPKFRCPQCNEELIFSGGCIECRACGYSKCD